MQIVFMGTPEFAIPSLKILVDHQYPIAAAVTIPDRPQGRGQQLTPSPMKKFALQHQIPLLQPESLKDEIFIGQLKNLKPELFIVVAFRILPKQVFTIPARSAFNLHASLLPKYRGAAPIHWAIINGERETGVTTFFLEEKVDTGNIILQARTPIGPDETFGELHDKLADIGAEIVLHTVRLIEMGKTNPQPQNDAKATPASKILKEHCKIDWTKSAQAIHNLVRGLSPTPCAFTMHGDKMIKIYRTKIFNSDGGVESTSQIDRGRGGTALEANKRLLISAGEGTIEILELQQEGKRRMTAEEFLRGYRITAGERFS